MKFSSYFTPLQCTRNRRKFNLSDISLFPVDRKLLTGISGRFCSEFQGMPDDKDTKDDPRLSFQSRARGRFIHLRLLRIQWYSMLLFVLIHTIEQEKLVCYR